MKYKGCSAMEETGLSLQIGWNVSPQLPCPSLSEGVLLFSDSLTSVSLHAHIHKNTVKRQHKFTVLYTRCWNGPLSACKHASHRINKLCDTFWSSSTAIEAIMRVPVLSVLTSYKDRFILLPQYPKPFHQSAQSSSFRHISRKWLM
jgi:hypothetical protein